MKTTKLIFLRHADTHKDPDQNPAQWGLSEEGILAWLSSYMLWELVCFILSLDSIKI
jgi:hypothetical protein